MQGRTIDIGVENVTLSGGGWSNIVFGTPPGSGNPFERWYNIGFTHKISNNSMFRMLWQMSDFDMKGGGIALDPFSNNPGTNSTHKGGLLTSQLTVKF